MLKNPTSNHGFSDLKSLASKDPGLKLFLHHVEEVIHTMKYLEVFGPNATLHELEKKQILISRSESFEAVCFNRFVGMFFSCNQNDFFLKKKRKKE